MSAVPPPEIAPPDPCPDCGYDRRALETGRPCPECGYVQPADEFVAWGWTRTNTRAGWKTLWPIFVVMPAMFLLSKAMPKGAFESWAFAAVAPIVVGTIYVWQRLQRGPADGGPQQLRLSPRGFAVRTGFGPVEFKPWTGRGRVYLRESFFGRTSVVFDQPLVGPIMAERPLVFRTSPGQATLVAGRINALLRDA